MIVDKLTKMIYYKPIFITLDGKPLVEVLIKTVIKYHGLLNFIVTDQKSLFISKFESVLFYYLNIKRQLNINFQLQTDK